MIVSGESIIHPGDAVGRVDYEVELAVIISKYAWRVPVENAFNFIYGYTVINDVTARDLQVAFGSRGHPWFLAKSMATFCPIGPVVALRDNLDPMDLVVECYLNGELRQHGQTSQMIYDIPTIIAFITARLPLLPGDIIATGTPAGIGPLAPGDQISGRVEGIGDLMKLGGGRERSFTIINNFVVKEKRCREESSVTQPALLCRAFSGRSP